MVKLHLPTDCKRKADIDFDAGGIRPLVHRERALIDPMLADPIRRCAAGESPWPLFVDGNVGTGKTCAALCLCDRVHYPVPHCERCGRAHGGIGFWDYAQLCEEYRTVKMDRFYWPGAQAGGTVATTEYWKAFGRYEFVVIDDIGIRGAVTDNQYDALKEVLERRDYKPLMLLSNLTLGQISDVFDDRIASRCAAGTVVSLSGVDKRLLTSEVSAQ